MPSNKTNYLKAVNPLKTKSLVLALASGLFVLNFCVSPAVYGAGRIDLVVEHGVDKDAEAQVRLAVEATLNFFQKTYGLGLEKDIRILINPDKTAYKNDLKRWHQLSEAEAGLRANISSGLHRSGTIIINLEGTHNNYGQFSILCHELVHHFQCQESPGKYGSIRWMTEGMADVLAAHILETAGIKGAAGYQEKWRAMVKKARGWPKLENLHTGGEWYAAMGAYGPITYKTAGLAVLTLIEWRGYQQLFAYFRALKNARPEDAFYQAFGAKISDFEKSFRPF